MDGGCTAQSRKIEEPAAHLAHDGGARELVTELPTDALSSVLRLNLAHEIAAVAPTCRAFNLAVRHAIAARRFTGEVVARWAQRRQ